MSDNDKNQRPKKDSASTEDTGDLGVKSLQDAFDEANEKGYFGETPDETPNEAYTVEGVTKGKRDGK